MEKETTNKSHLEEAYLILRNKLDTLSNTFMVSRDDAEDLVQEGFLKLENKKMRNPEEARGKLWTTIKNLAIDRFRRKRKMIDIGQYELPCIEHIGIDTNLIFQQLTEILSPLQNQIMTLLIKEELDYPEIAERLNMKEGAVRTAVSRARKILKEKLEL